MVQVELKYKELLYILHKIADPETLSKEEKDKLFDKLFEAKGKSTD